MSSEFTPETERQRLQYLVRDLRTKSDAAHDKHCPVVSKAQRNAAEHQWLIMYVFKPSASVEKILVVQISM